MELNRASLIIGTPPSTPRNSMMLTNSSTQMFDLQEFLSKVDTTDNRSRRGTIHEVEENDPDHLFMQEQAAEYKASQQSMSQHSKSSTSLHSAHSASSLNRGGPGSSSPVIVNPAAMTANSNFNNSNDGGGAGEYLDLQEMLSSAEMSQSDGLGSRDTLGSVGVASMPHAEQRSTLDRHMAVSAKGAESKAAKLSLGQQRHSTYAQKSEALSKRTFHKSSGNVQEGEGRRGKSGKTPPLNKKMHRSSVDITSVEERGSDFGDRLGPLGLDLSDLADLTRSSEEMLGMNTQVFPPRMSREDLPPPTESEAESESKTEPPQHSEIRHSQNEPPPLPQNNSSGQHSNQDSGDLLSWEDFLVSTSPTHQGPQAAPPTLSEGSGDDSVWLDYGSV